MPGAINGRKSVPSRATVNTAVRHAGWPLGRGAVDGKFRSSSTRRVAEGLKVM
jgi:hypothetical protein